MTNENQHGPRKCSRCKMMVVWQTYHKTCPPCRSSSAAAYEKREKLDPTHADQRERVLMSAFTPAKAWEIVEYAESGLQDEQLAMVLKIRDKDFKKWRNKGQYSANPEDPFFILYYEVEAVRAKRFAEMLEKWRDSTNLKAQTAWMEWAFQEQRPPPIRPSPQVVPRKGNGNLDEDIPPLQFRGVSK